VGKPMQTNNNRRQRAIVARPRIQRKIVGETRKQKAGRRRDELLALMAPSIPQNLMRNNPFPQQMVRKLKFDFTGFLQGASPFILKEFSLNSAFSPDGSASKPSGFNELAAIYNFYRVINCKIYYRVANNEPAIPVQFGVIMRDTQPSTVITTFALAYNALEIAPSTGLNLVGQTTGMAVYRSQEYEIDLGSVVGNRLEYLTDTSYRGLISTAPNQLIWATFVLLGATAATNLTNGALVEISIEMTTMFYSNNVLPS